MTVIQRQVSSTPALVFDERTLLDRSNFLRVTCDKAGAALLYALKPCTHISVLHILRSSVDGFAASSLFEAKLARAIGNGRHTIHLTTPGLRADEIGELVEECDYIAFNSLSQWQRYRPVARRAASCGLRVNPKLPFVRDDRYNPCRSASKLGVPLERLETTLREAPEELDGLRGLHLHTNCDATEFAPLLATVQRLDERLAPFLQQVEWVNLGGGYLFTETAEVDAFIEAVQLLRSKYHVTVFVEPGAAFVRSAGQLISSVVDLFTNDGKRVAVLDTTVNHMPELFEYQCSPEVVGATGDGRYAYLLVGGTCLAGDLFGEFAFDEPLEVGSRVVFADAGSYTLVKAHTFNGMNLPTIYTRRVGGGLALQTEFTYEDFARRNGVEAHALI